MLHGGTREGREIAGGVTALARRRGRNMIAWFRLQIDYARERLPAVVTRGAATGDAGVVHRRASKGRG